MTPEQAEAAREAAWQAYDAIADTPPECEHIQEWHEQVSAARRAHLEAAAACDQAQRAAARNEARP